MNLLPLFSTEDLARLFQVSERTAGRRMVKARSKIPKPYLKRYLEKNPGGSRPFLIQASYVSIGLGISSRDLVAYWDRQLNSPLCDLMDERDFEAVATGRWLKRCVWLEGTSGEIFAVKRMGYFHSSSGAGDFIDGMGNIEILSIPVSLITSAYLNDFKRIFENSKLISSVLNLFWDSDLNQELARYMSRMTGRRYAAVSIVVVEKLEGRGSTGSTLDLLKALGKNLHRERALVFLPDSLIVENAELITASTGFRKLEGTPFHISAGIDRFKEVRFKIWYV